MCFLRHTECISTLPTDWHRTRPLCAYPEMGEGKVLPPTQNLLDRTGQYRVETLYGVSQINNIANLKPRRLNRRGEDSIQRCVFEVILSAQHGEGLSRTKHIDHLISAEDVQVMHS